MQRRRRLVWCNRYVLARRWWRCWAALQGRLCNNKPHVINTSLNVSNKNKHLTEITRKSRAGKSIDRSHAENYSSRRDFSCKYRWNLRKTWMRCIWSRYMSNSVNKLLQTNGMWQYLFLSKFKHIGFLDIPTR